MATPTNSILPSPPVRTALLNSDNTLASTWVQWFTQLIQIINAIDFETGTWTPDISSGTITGTVTATGSWSKIGNQVFFNASINATAGTYVANTISNLPLPATGSGAASVVTGANLSIGIGTVTGSVVKLPPMTLSPASPTNTAIVTGSYPYQP